MKQRYILPALLLLCSACQQEEWAQPEADSPDAIHFAAPVITVEKLTRSTFHDAFPTGGTFGVLATACLISVAVTPKRTGHRAARTGVTRAATPSPTCSSIKPSPTTARPALMTIITVAARENGTTRRKIRRRPPPTAIGTPFSPITRRTVLQWKVPPAPPHGACRN